MSATARERITEVAEARGWEVTEEARWAIWCQRETRRVFASFAANGTVRDAALYDNTDRNNPKMMLSLGAGDSDKRRRVLDWLRQKRPSDAARHHHSTDFDAAMCRECKQAAADWAADHSRHQGAICTTCPECREEHKL